MACLPHALAATFRRRREFLDDCVEQLRVAVLEVEAEARLERYPGNQSGSG